MTDLDSSQLEVWNIDCQSVKHPKSFFVTFQGLLGLQVTCKHLLGRRMTFRLF